MLRGKRAWLCEVTSIWHLCSCFTILPELCFKDESHELLFFWFPFSFQMNRISGQRGGKNWDFSFLCLLLIAWLLFRARVSLRSQFLPCGLFLWLQPSFHFEILFISQCSCFFKSVATFNLTHIWTIDLRHVEYSGVPVVAQGVKNLTQCPRGCGFHPWTHSVG